MHQTTVVPERDKYLPLSYVSRIHIDHKMFDMFTSRNVKKKSLNVHSHVRPNTWSAFATSDQILGGCRLSNLSDISLEWIRHFGRDISDLKLRVSALIHFEGSVCYIKCIVERKNNNKILIKIKKGTKKNESSNAVLG